MTIKNPDAIEVLEAFLQSNQPVAFTVLGDKTERCNFNRKMLVKVPKGMRCIYSMEVNLHQIVGKNFQMQHNMSILNRHK